MKVLVDTSVWSAVLRRVSPPHSDFQSEMEELITEGRVVMLGPIRQELLSGLRNEGKFRQLRDSLRAFPDLESTAVDYEEAAACFNRCRAKGIQGSNTDFLICAVALRNDFEIFTADGDFEALSQVLPIRLYVQRRHLR